MRHVLRLLVVSMLTSLAFFAASGTASAGSLLGGGCGEAGAAFSEWGDGTDYYFPTNGGFEGGSTGWSLAGGAAVVQGNESYYLHSAGDSHALYMPSGSSAAYNVCYGTLYPSIRFMVAGSAKVHVWITTKNLLGLVSTLDGGSFYVSGGSWNPSPRLSSLLSALIAPLGTKQMQVHIGVSGGSAQIDDLYVDPLLTKC